MYTPGIMDMYHTWLGADAPLLMVLQCKPGRAVHVLALHSAQAPGTHVGHVGPALSTVNQ